MHNLSGLVKGGVWEMTPRLLLEVGEEVLDGSIVPAIAAPGHGRRDGILPGKDKIRLGSVWGSLVTVEDQSISDLLCLFGLSEGGCHQGNGIALRESMPDNEAIVQVLDRREIGPALLGQNVSHIGNPFLVRL